jgi:hypothetical protein
MRHTKQKDIAIKAMMDDGRRKSSKRSPIKLCSVVLVDLGHVKQKVIAIKVLMDEGSHQRAAP